MTGRGTDFFRGALAGFTATVPWIVAGIGWAAGWNAYLNLFLTLGGFVLWLTVFQVCRDAR